MRRRLQDELRRRRRDHAELYDPVDLPIGTAVTGVGTQSDTVDPETVVLAEFDATEAVELIGRVLPTLQAEVVLLRVVGGLTVTEIAMLLELAPGYVRVAAHRGLRTLAAHFSRPLVTERTGVEIPEVP